MQPMNWSSVESFWLFLRNTRLDELQQLWNAPKGEMRLAGPRPECLDFVTGLDRAIPDRARRACAGSAEPYRPTNTGIVRVHRKLFYVPYHS